MDDRTFRFGRPFLDDPDRAKTQALCSDLAITAAPPSGQGTKPCWVLWGETAIKTDHAANCLRLPPLLTIVFHARPDKTKDQRSYADLLEQLPISPSLLFIASAGSTTERLLALFRKRACLALTSPFYLSL